ncbi:MAG: hypothetical protein ACI867_002375 [Glaciecola sp.]|jgi:hypothetical protein
MSSSAPTIDPASLLQAAPTLAMRKVDQILERASWLLMPAGFVFIILGWVGASRTPLMFEQIPYLISGGLLGLGMMIAGGLLYVGSWVARTAQLIPTETPTAGLLHALQGLIDTNGNTGVVPVAPGVGPPGTFVRTPNGTMFHRDGCSIVTSRDDVVGLTRKQSAGFQACAMCDPLAS